jgi:uncharacterized protein
LFAADDTRHQKRVARLPERRAADRASPGERIRSTLKAFIARRPLLASLMFTVSDLPFVIFGLTLLPRLAPGLPDMAIKLIVLMVQVLIVVFWLTALGWWREAGFNRPSEWRSLHLYWLPLLLMALFPVLLGVHLGSLAALAPILILALLIGFQEDAVFRGLIVRANLPHGTMRAVLTSALLFGLVHATAIMFRDPAFVATQIIASGIGGIGLAALRVRTNTIWPLVLLHAYNDTVQFLAVGGASYSQIPAALTVLKLTGPIVLALYGLYLVRDAWWPQGGRVATELVGR